MRECKVTFIDHMGSDLTVVNTARASFDKQVEKFSDRDERLINFLARNGHWTPFAHCSIQFRIEAPIFVARQLVKHQVGLVWSEVSRRYVTTEPDYYRPRVWRSNPENIKQGSSDIPADLNQEDIDDIAQHLKSSSDLYKRLLKKGVCPEMARMLIPGNMVTSWYWTGSLYAFARVVNERCANDAQRETKEVGDGIALEGKRLFPVSWKALVNEV